MTFLRDCDTLDAQLRPISDDRVAELCLRHDVVSVPLLHSAAPGDWTERCTASPIRTYSTMMRVIGKTNSMNVDSCSRTRASDSHSADTVQMSESCSGLPSRGSLR